MSYAFHDIKNIIQPYLDDLPAHSRKLHDHPNHLQQIFLHCRHYIIRLNPHKCVFCFESRCLLGFIVSKDGIGLDPLKVKAIVNLPPPSSLLQLQSLQGKVNFPRRLYAKLALGFTQLLKQGIPFIWDEATHKPFNELKVVLINAPLLHLANFHRDYFLYLTAASSTIAMVLVQDNDKGHEHDIYYLSCNLLDPEMCYAHVEKLALGVIQAI